MNTIMSVKYRHIKVNRLSGFTIIELLVAIVVIGILSSIVFISYNGVVDRAISSSLQSDLSNSLKKIEMYRQLYGVYPVALDNNNCPTGPVVDNDYCLKPSQKNYLAYSSNIYFNPTSFNLAAQNENGTTYAIDNGKIIPRNGSLTFVSSISTGTSPTRLSISSDGAFAYVPNSATSASTISMYSRNVETGELTNIGTVPAGISPKSIAISTDGTSAYVGNYESIDNTSTVYIYKRDTKTGALTNQEVIRLDNVKQVSLITIAKDGASVHIFGNQILNSGPIVVSFIRDPGTGSLTINNRLLFSPWYSYSLSGLTMSFDDKFLYTSCESTPFIHTFLQKPGPIKIFQSLNNVGAEGASGIVISPDNTSVYVSNKYTSSISMYRLSNEGKLIYDGKISAGGTPYDINISADGTFLYTTNYNKSLISTYSRNIKTGKLRYIGDMNSSGGSPYKITTYLNGNFIYIVNSSSKKISIYKSS